MFDVDDVKKLIARQLDLDPEDITPEKSFAEDLGADSLDQVEIIMGIEDAYNISIPAEVAMEIHTVGDALEQLKKALE